MKIQFAVALKDRFGEPLREPDPRNLPQFRNVTLGDVCCAVLDMNLQGEEPKEKVRRWELIREITKAEQSLQPLDMLESDVEMIRQRMFRSSFSATVCGGAVELLSPVPAIVGKAA